VAEVNRPVVGLGPMWVAVPVVNRPAEPVAVERVAAEPVAVEPVAVDPVLLVGQDSQLPQMLAALQSAWHLQVLVATAGLAYHS